MHTKSIGMKLRLASGALVVALLVACTKPGETLKPPLSAPEPTPAPAAPVPQVSTPAPAPAAAITVPHPALAMASSTKVSTRAAVTEPALTSMAMARTNSKMGVPVDLHYQIDGDALSGQPVTVHLAAVPRVAGSNLAVSIKQVAGIKAAAAGITAEKVSASTAYRQQLSVTRQAEGPKELRVLVTMDLPEGKAFSYFSVPLDGAQPATKKDRNRIE